MLRGSFLPSYGIALFLDVDGTLLEIAAAPDAVRVPAALRNTLQLAAQREDGALALISGRSIADLDRLFAPSTFPASGLHGSERRDFRGHVTRIRVDHSKLQSIREQLSEWAADRPGTLLEDKGVSVALHFRNAPQFEADAHDVIGRALRALSPTYCVLPGKCVVELAPASCSKRAAIEAFMDESPFAGRTPVFVGDDVTDEVGFEAVNAMGGYSVHVGTGRHTAARHRFASVTGVVAWLRERNTRIPRFSPDAP